MESRRWDEPASFLKATKKGGGGESEARDADVGRVAFVMPKTLFRPCFGDDFGRLTCAAFESWWLARL